MENRLVTARVKELLAGYPLYSQDGKREDAVCSCVFRIGNVRWYILEGQQEGEDFTFYGVVAGMYETEYGYMSANEMEGISIDGTPYGVGRLQVEQDTSFQPCRLGEIADEDLQAHLHRLYDQN